MRYTVAEFLQDRIAEIDAKLRVTIASVDLGDSSGMRKIDGQVFREQALAELDAKRRIVERCRPRYAAWFRESDRLIAEGFDLPTVPTVATAGPMWPFEGAEDILRILATLWADHPDFDEEWRI